MRVKKNKGKQSGDQLRKLESDVKRLLEMVNNLNAYAMEQVRARQQDEVMMQMLTTCVTLCVKDVLGRGLSEEETAALVEALDGKVADSGEDTGPRGEEVRPADGSSSEGA